MIQVESESLSDKDIEQVAALHQQNIDRGFLSSLGTKFLSMLYRAIADNNSAHLIIAKVDGSVKGFVSGASSLRPIYKAMIRDNLVALPLALLPKMLSMETIRKVLEVLQQSQHDTATRPDEELLSIAVDNSFRGQGIADKLYNELARKFKEGGSSSFCIVVGEVLVPAQKFYERMGAVKIDETEVHKGDKSFVYEATL